MFHMIKAEIGSVPILHIKLGELPGRTLINSAWLTTLLYGIAIDCALFIVHFRKPADIAAKEKFQAEVRQTVC
jgi:hypothetical protein